MQVARKSEDVDVLLVSYDLQSPRADREQTRERIEKFVAERDWRLPVVIFDGVEQEALDQRFELPGPIPVTLALDRNGAIVDREDGPCGKERFEALVERARSGR